MTCEFKAWGKTPRWSNEEMTITEKIDGTNACVCIFPFEDNGDPNDLNVGEGFVVESLYGERYIFGAQSRTRMITPVKGKDNAGFAAWAYENSSSLIEALGYGRHYGEWWGSGIQKGYGAPQGERTFSLFDVWRWNDALDLSIAPEALTVVPTLYQGPSSEVAVADTLQRLAEYGSVASSGYRNPEGVIISYKLTRQSYKAFVNDDGIPKSMKEGK